MLKNINKKFKLSSIGLVLLLLILSACSDPILKPAFIIADKPADIRSVEGKWVRPVVYDNKINFTDLTIEKKKKKFVEMLLPSILMVKHNLAVERSRVGSLMWKINNGEDLSAFDKQFLADKMVEFKAKNYRDLYSRMATHPTSIVLAQAAIESGWGSSRFFNEANNIFGVWSYNKNEDRIMASHKRGDKAIYVRKYPDLRGSIRDYFLTLARVNAYEKYRGQRQKIKDPYQLIHLLSNYSELRGTYVSRLRQVMKKNDLTQYDDLKIDPAYYTVDHSNVIF